MASSAALTTTHLPTLRALLDEWSAKQPPAKAFASPSQDIASRLEDEKAGEVRGKDIIVAFRTRPPLPDEAAEKFHASEDKESAVVGGDGEDKAGDAAEEPAKAEFCSGVTATSAEPGTFVAHVPGFKWSGPTLTHKSYEADLAFGPTAANDELYQRTVVANDMIPLALSSGIACILAYGQTGSGKTYTMEALEHRIARDLFIAAKHVGARLLQAEEQAKASSAGTDSTEDLKPDTVFEFSVTFLELLGKRAVDLLEPADGLPIDAQGNAVRKEVPIHEDKNGDVRPRLISRVVQSAEQLDELITTALSHRRTSATLRNATSSRSHAVLTIRATNKLLPFAEPGQLLLVDLAGSERYEDSKAHDKQRMLESRENNNSLMSLKECVRAKAKMATEEGFVHIPWRSNKLTMLLKPIFDIESRQPSKTLIIAHVSPHIQDTVHSVNTLSYASPFKTSPPKPRGPAPYDAADPRTWDHEQTVAWLTQEFTKRQRARVVNAHKVRAEKAAKDGKKVKPLDDSAPVALVVDIEKLCPRGMTGKHYGQLYTVDFVQRTLEAARLDREYTASVVKNMAAEVVGTLYYLILTAKTRKRRAVMQSRKVVNLEAAYGDTPYATVPGTSIRMPEEGSPEHSMFARWTNEQFLAAAARHGPHWHERLNAAVYTARQQKKNTERAELDACYKMMEEEYGTADTPAA
ncbi:kinesin motor domain-containing protein [Phanerochaete sordida]|uniref:Kinesin-like protein n=1 Tax=Phanerochaete sordida TaxID=48140 RepID=A0A9P3LGV0_9APHY|nr:kinesin motor domain-containing protein [Phanerochaete sordida]